MAREQRIVDITRKIAHYDQELEDAPDAGCQRMVNN